MAAARAHRRDVGVARAACCALVNLSLADDCRDDLASGGVRKFLAFVLGLHSGDDTVQDYCRRVVL